MISIVIPTCTPNAAKIEKLFLSIFDQSNDIIIVENGIKTHWLENLCNGYNCRYFFTDKPGSNHARNIGISLAREKWVAFTDDDCRADTSCFLNFERAILDNLNIGLIGGKIKVKFDKEPPKWFVGPFLNSLGELAWDEDIQDEYEYDGLLKINGNKRYVVSGNVVINKQKLIDMAGFPESFGYTDNNRRIVNDETFLFKKLQEKYGMLYCKDAVMYHYIPPKKATLEYMEGRFYGHGWGTAQNFHAENPTISKYNMYHDFVQPKSLEFINYAMILKMREQIRNENITREFIRNYVRCQYQYMNGIIDATEVLCTNNR